MKIVTRYPRSTKKRGRGSEYVSLPKFFGNLKRSSKMEIKTVGKLSSEAAKSADFAYLFSQLESALISGKVRAVVFIRCEDLFPKIANEEAESLQTADEELEFEESDELKEGDRFYNELLEEDYHLLPKDGLEGLPTFGINRGFWMGGDLKDAIRKAIVINPGCLVHSSHGNIGISNPSVRLEELIYIEEPDAALAQICDPNFLDWPDVDKRFEAYEYHTCEVVGGAWRSIAMAEKQLTRVEILRAVEDYLDRHFPGEDRLGHTRINELATMIFEQLNNKDQHQPILPGLKRPQRKKRAKRIRSGQ